ncbi:MAG TPA: TonB family protein [Vicinamibacterales bacterium]|nr:TonB family protein [Vicinamibacterales bacterium]
MMDALSLAFVIYSSQILFVVFAAAMAEALLHRARPTVRLGYWRAIGVLCLALPLIASSGTNSPVATVTFSVLPAQDAAVQTVAKALPAVGPIVLWIWACGAIAGLAWLLAGACRVRQMRQRSTPASLEPDVDEMRIALAARAEFRWSNDVQQPVTLGVRRPIVLLPRRFDELTHDAKRAVACHELLHIKRRDWLWTVLEAHVRALLWFHPAVWWLLDRVQLLREQVIDQLVVERTSTPRDYMLALMMFADGERPTALSSAFLRRRHLKSRLSQLVKEKHMSARRLLCTMAALMLIVGGVTIATVKALPLELGALAQADAPSRMVIRLAETTPADGLRAVVVPGSNERIYLHATPLATWEDVSLVKIINDANGQIGVTVTFEPAVAARMASATAAHLGKPLAILLDGRVVSALTLKGPIGNSAVITGITAAVAQQLVDANVACHTNPAQCAAAVLPVPIYQERPQYTPAAMAAQIEGTVALEITVLADGSVGDVKVVRSLDSEFGLDQEAVKALKLWTWKPGTRGGQPSSVTVQIEMTFTLK